MAHNLCNNNAYIGRQAAWHRLGTVTGKYQSTDDLLAHPIFQYRVFKSQLHDGLGRPIDAWGMFRWDYVDEVAGLKDKTVFLAPVGADFNAPPFKEGFTTCDALMQTADGAHYETAGVLGKGEKVWALCDLGLAIKVGDDVQKGFLLFTAGFDGRTSHSYRICFTRVVCENTHNIALNEKTRAVLTIKNTKNSMNRIVNARKALTMIGDDVKSVEDKLLFLAGRKLTREAMMDVLDRLFPKQEEAKITTRRDNILADVLKLYESNDGNAFPEQRGTSYNLLQAITNYADHERGTEERRAESAMFGSGDKLKNDAFEILSDVSKKLDPMYQRGPSVVVDFAAIGLNVPMPAMA